MIGGIFLALLLIGALVPGGLVWDGRQMVPVHLTAIEEDNGRPIENARVSITPSNDGWNDEMLRKIYKPILTDHSGNVDLLISCGAGGSQGMFLKTGSFIVRQELVVEADGYRSIRTPLENILGKDKWPLRQKQFDIKIWMIPTAETIEKRSSFGPPPESKAKTNGSQ